MPEWVARGGQWVLEEGYSAKKDAAKKNPCSVIRFNYNKPKNEADKRRSDFTTRNDNKRLKRTLEGNDALLDQLRNILQPLSNVTKYWLIYNAGDSCYILTGGYNENEWEQQVHLYSRPDGVTLLEEDINNIENYDAEKYDSIGKLMDELQESEASIDIASRQNKTDKADECCTDDDDKSTTPSPKLPLNINIEEENGMDFTSENEPELRCNDNKNDTSPRSDSCEKKNDGGSERSVKPSPADAMFDVSQFTNENDASHTPLPPADSVDLDEKGVPTKFTAQPSSQIPTSSSSCRSPSPKKATHVRSIVENKNTIHNNPSKSTLLSNPTTMQHRVDIPPSQLQLASTSAFNTTSSRELFQKTTTSSLKSPLLNDTNHTNIDTDIEPDNANINDENALAASQHQKVEDVLSDGNPSVNEMVGIDESEESNEREDFSDLTVAQLKDRLRGLNLRLGGRKQELLDRLNDHLYPAPAVEESDAAGADSDVDMGNCVNDRERDVVVSVETDIESDVHHFTECNARDTITIDGIYGSVPIPTIFSNRELSKVIVEVPSIGEEDTLGIDIKHSPIFARAQIGSVSESSSLHTQISSKYNNNIILAIEYEKEIPTCKSSNYKTVIEQLNKARANGPVVVSLILARPFHNTLEGARSQLESKLKKENYNDADEIEQHDIDQAVEVISECLEYIYNHPTEFERFFFKDPSQFTTLKDAEKKGKIGGVYIGVQQWHIYLKFGTSMSNCKNREELRKLLYTWLFCNDKEALAMIPPQFIDRLMALSNLPCMEFDPTQHLSKRYYFAIIIIEAILSSIHPTITNTVGDLVVQALPAHLKAIADPYVAPELINEVRELGFGLPDDLIQFLLTWITFPSDVDQLRQQAKSTPSLAKYDLFNQHLPDCNPNGFLTLFLYKELAGSRFHGNTDCIKVSPRLIRLLRLVKRLKAVMTGDVLSQFQEDGTVDDSIAEKLYNVLSPIMEFGEHYEEYESPSAEELAAPMLLQQLSLNVIVHMEQQRACRCIGG